VPSLKHIGWPISKERKTEVIQKTKRSEVFKSRQPSPDMETGMTIFAKSCSTYTSKRCTKEKKPVGGAGGNENIVKVARGAQNVVHSLFLVKTKNGKSYLAGDKGHEETTII